MGSLIEKLAASNGSFLIADTTARTGLNVTSFYVREDSVVSLMTGTKDDGTSVTFTTTLGISGKSLKAGDLFCIPQGQRVTAITMTSGSIIVY